MTHDLLKMAKCAKIESKQFQDELSKYLFAYRSTPHCTTGVSPAELLMGRRLRTKLPCILDTDEFVECEHFADNSALKSNAMNRDEIRKQRNKSYRDAKVKAKVKDLKPGSQVLLQYQRRQNKMTPIFEAKPYEVVEKHGNAVTVRASDGTVKMRNAAHMKELMCVPENLQYKPHAIASRVDQLLMQRAAEQKKPRDPETSVGETSKSDGTVAVTPEPPPPPVETVSSDKIVAMPSTPQKPSAGVKPEDVTPRRSERTRKPKTIVSM